MATLEELSAFAQTAQAAYALGLIPNDDNASALIGADMSISQASQFAATWNVLEQSSPTLNGFSAVLLENKTTHEKVLAIAGTDPGSGADWFTDLVHIAMAGYIGGMPQWNSLESFYQQLIANGKLTATEEITVTGHSLGGFLAQAFTANHASIVSAAYTYNSPGFNGAQTQLLEYLGIADGSGTNSKITNAYAIDGFSTAAGLGIILGDRRGIRIEVSPIPYENHSIARLADALAVNSLLSQLDPSLSDVTSNALIQVASNSTDRTLEDLLDSVRRMILVGPIVPTGTGALYANIESLSDSGAFAALTGNLHISTASEILATEAISAFSAFLALQTLSVMVLRGNNTTNQTLLDATLGGTNVDLYARWQADQGLTAIERAAGMAEFGDRWLADRAALLGLIVQRNLDDSTSPLSTVLSNGIASTFTDVATGLQISTGSSASRSQIIFGDDAANNVNGGTLGDRLYGGAGADTLYGYDGNDYLEGGAGNDTLTSGQGRDVLDGGIGFDGYWISANEQSATIRDADGSGAIVIERADLSFYTLGSGGLEVIPGNEWSAEDDEGNQFVLTGGQLFISLAGGRSVTVQGFSDGDLGIDLPAQAAIAPPTTPTLVPTFIVTPSNPNGTYADGSGGIDLRHFSYPEYASPYTVSAYSGGTAGPFYTEVIDLSSAPLQSGFSSIAIVGGLGDSYIVGSAYRDAIIDDYDAGTGNGVFWSSGDVPGNDVLIGGLGNDVLETHGGNDQSYGGDGNDLIMDVPLAHPNDAFSTDITWLGTAGHFNADRLYGEAGNDVIAAAAGDAYLDGGDGNDELYGGAHDDTLIGGAGADVLSGDSRVSSTFWTYAYPYGIDLTVSLSGHLTEDAVAPGNDYLDGGDGDDKLIGGGGDDVLIGGGGNDVMQGDTVFIPSGTQALSSTHGLTPLLLQGADYMLGGAGADTLYGGAGDDVIDAGTENDTAFAGAGDDVVYGGSGVDYLVGDDATGEQGNDEIHGDADGDSIFGMGGNDRLYGEAGTDTIVGGDGDDIIEGGDGDDYSYFNSSIGLFGGAGNDVLIGGAGQDRLQGGDGNDRLESSSGGDLLFGEAGDDTYVVGLGAGASLLTDYQGSNTLIFGQGIQVQDVVVTMSNAHVFIDFSSTDYIETYATHFDTFGSVSFADGTTLSNHEFRQLFQPGNIVDRYIQLSVGVTSGEIGFVRWNNDLLLTYEGAVANGVITNNFANHEIVFERSDGTSYGMSSDVQIVALTNWFLGNPSTYVNTLIESGGTQFNFASVAASAASTFLGGSADNVLMGTESSNALVGLAGNDLISGLGGNDDLIGGQGDDFLSGGGGNDTYQYAIGDGKDFIVDESGASDVLNFASGITSGDLTITEQTDGLHIQVGPSVNSDEIIIANWSAGGGKSIDKLTFNGSGTLDREDIDLLNIGNHSPRVIEEIGKRRAPLGQGFVYVVPSTVISDADAGDILTFQAGMENPLPSWLSFDAATHTFSGTPAAGDEGLISVDLRATDSGGLTTSTVFFIDVPSVYSGSPSADYLSAQGENSVILYGLDGDDDLVGGVGNDELYGGNGHDDLEGGDGDDYLEGGAGNDQLEGDAGADVFVSGAGNDFIYTYEWGAADARDTIRVFIGDGTDEMILDYIGDNDVIEFGPGITAQYVLENAYFTTDGWWVIRYNPNNASDRIQIRNYGAWSGDSVDPQDITTIGTFLRFDGGAEYTLADVFNDMNVLTMGNDSYVATGSTPINALASDDLVYVEGSIGLTVNGGAGNDILDGTSSAVGVVLDGGTGNDRLVGTEFADHLTGGDGDDILNSFSGEDVLEGGTGSDTYTRDEFYGAPGEILTVSDAGGWDTLESGLRMSQSTFSRIGDDLSISQTISGATSTLLVEDWYVSNDRRIDRIEFTTGVSYTAYFYSADQIEGLVSGINTAPIVSRQMEDVGASVGQSFSQFYSADNAIDTQTSYGSLTRTVRLVDGSPLPAWLSYVGQTFSGTPGAGDVGELRVVIESRDAGGLSVIDEFTIVVGSGIVFGNNSNNTYNGSSSANIYFGRDGNDNINGNGGNDQLYGGIGNDTLSGGDGDDILAGGPGADSLVGGIGTNIYRLNPTDGADTHAMSTTGVHRFQFGAGITSANISAEMFAAADGSIGMRVRYYEDAASDVLQLSIVFTLVGNDLQLNSNAGAYTFEFRDSSQLTVSQLIDLASSSLSPTAGDDFLMLTSAGTVDGGEGADVIVGSSSTDQLYGSGGADRIYGMGGVDAIYGGDGNDVLSGGTGVDTASGGMGDDLYIVESSSDVSTEASGEGIDAVESSATYALGSNIENLTLTGSAAINGTGNTLGNVLVGNSGSNTLSGLSGADTLNPGSAGTDVLQGGQGDDTYIVTRTSGITITENTSEGTDTVQASVTHTLANNVESLVLTGTSAINGTGNTLANTLTGNSNNNTLSGGTGADTMIGGAGNDTYVVDSTSDVTTELAGEGTDLVQSSVTYTLASEVENLTLTGSSALNGTGNGLANALVGNSGNNTLTGLGGNDTFDPGTAGTDVLVGGLGDDTYTVARTTGITITESIGEGTDLVMASISYTLGNNVENLTLTGSSTLTATGNSLDNVLTGNSGNNTLTGNGGNDTLNGQGGTDTMVGGQGNDIYYVDVSGDVTTEAASEGTDLVNSGVTRTLAANIELLFLTGTSAINGTGNTLANLVRGNSGINTLVGDTGTDILEGGDGNDILSDSGGNTLLNGGIGTDTLTGTTNNDLLIGGTGNDALTTGSGADILAFNAGHGQDTVAVSTTQDNTVSIGGGITYADLLFQKSGNNLILQTGSGNQITFTNYYSSTANRSVDFLQVVIEGTSDYNAGSGNAMNNKMIQTFDFDDLVAAFDAALVINPGLSSWALTNALLTEHLGGSDTAARGGDLAYRYGLSGSLSDISFTPAIGVLGAAGFGSSAQTLQTLGSLQDATARLQ